MITFSGQVNRVNFIFYNRKLYAYIGFTHVDIFSV